MREKLIWIDAGVARVAYLRDGTDRRYVILKGSETELFLVREKKISKRFDTFHSVEAAKSEAERHHKNIRKKDGLSLARRRG
jgi:hypothetical protein